MNRYQQVCKLLKDETGLSVYHLRKQNKLPAHEQNNPIDKTEKKVVVYSGELKTNGRQTKRQRKKRTQQIRQLKLGRSR